MRLKILKGVGVWIADETLARKVNGEQERERRRIEIGQLLMIDRQTQTAANINRESVQTQYNSRNEMLMQNNNLRNELLLGK